jgi:hypothetical protein
LIEEEVLVSLHGVGSKNRGWCGYERGKIEREVMQMGKGR